MLRWFAKFKVRTVARCVECDLPLALAGMGPTRDSARGPVHNICIPTVVRADGPEAVQQWLAASTPSDFPIQVPPGSPGRVLLYRGRMEMEQLDKAIERLSTRELLAIWRQLSFLRRAGERRASRSWLPDSVRASESAEAEEVGRRMRAISDEVARRRS